MRNAAQKKKNFFLTMVFLVLACFFQFVLIGYQTIALLFAGLAVFTILLTCIPVGWIRHILVGLVLAGVICLGLIEIPIVAASAGNGPADAEYVIVLGAGVNGQEPSLSLYNRLVAAKAWLEEHPDGKAILSGGQGPGEQISEAEAMYRWLAACGIAEDRLYKEEQSTTTRENFQYSVALLKDLNGGTLPQPVAVVSSEYHLYRAEYLARQVGLEPVGVAAKTTLPVLRLNYFIREGAAVVRLWVWGY